MNFNWFVQIGFKAKMFEVQNLLPRLRVENFTSFTGKDKERCRRGCCCMPSARVAHRRASARLAAAHVNDIHLAWRFMVHCTTGDVKASYNKLNGDDHF